MISLETLKDNLKEKAAGLKIEAFETIGSTNTYLMERAEAGEPEGLVVVSGAQTRGRGRMFRKFFSPSETGVYLSLLLRPWMDPEDALLLTAAAAVAAAETIESMTGEAAGIRWPNDVLRGGRKVCGILAEGAYERNGGFRHVVLGVGFNVEEPKEGFPQDIKDTAGVVFAGPAPRDARERLAAGFLNRFAERYQLLCPSGAESAQPVAEEIRQQIMDEYRKHFYLLGKEVLITSGNGIHRGVLMELDEKCRLLAKREDGKEEWLFSGDAGIREI